MSMAGENGGYVPCNDLPSPMPDDPTGVIVGSNVGYVPEDMLAATLPAVPEGAIRGESVGFVPGPCECCETFTRVEASGFGISEFCGNPTWGTDFPGGLASVDGAAGKLQWADDGNPVHLTARQQVPITYVALPFRCRIKVKVGANPDGPILMLGTNGLGGIGSTDSWWRTEILGPFRGGGHSGDIDLRITIHGPGGATNQATLADAVGDDMEDTYFWFEVLCEERSMSIKAWPDGGGAPANWQATCALPLLATSLVTLSLLELAGGTFSGSGATLTYMQVDYICFTEEIGVFAVQPSQVHQATSWAGYAQYDPFSTGELFENLTSTNSGSYPTGHADQYLNSAGILWQEQNGIAGFITMVPPDAATTARVTGFIYNNPFGGHTQSWQIKVGTWGTGAPDGSGTVVASGTTANGDFTQFDFTVDKSPTGAGGRVQFWCEASAYDAPDDEPIALYMLGEANPASPNQFYIGYR